MDELLIAVCHEVTARIKLIMERLRPSKQKNGRFSLLRQRDGYCFLIEVLYMPAEGISYGSLIERKVVCKKSSSKNESYKHISRKTDIATYRDNACNQKESPRVQSIKINNNNYMQKIKDLDHKIRKFI